MDSVKILLFSDDEKLYNSTERIIGKKHQLKWCTYQQLENNRYPTADVVIFHFTKEIIERERACGYYKNKREFGAFNAYSCY